MKQSKDIIFWFILVFFTIIASWGIPSLVKKATISPDNYPFVYYSSMLKQLCLIDYKNKEFPMTDIDGNTYSVAQFDSLMPLLNFRQLMTNGTLPDSIDGHEITPQKLRIKNVVYKFTPSDIQTPDIGLYIMYESMPKRVGLKSPGDVFRIKDKIEFIDIETNTTNHEKSKHFQEAMLKEDFTFPAQWCVGDMNPRKPYDEGYFILDAKNLLFHVKMVNNRPFVRNTGVGEQIDIERLFTASPADKRFYGFILDKFGQTYIVGNNEGKYLLQALDVPTINSKEDELTIMGNLLYWTVSITTPSEKSAFGLEANSLERLDEILLDRKENKWDVVSRFLFPFYIDLKIKQSDYIQPRVYFTSHCALIVNLILAIISCFFVQGSKNRKVIFSIYIAITGVAGMIALLALINFYKHKINKQ